MVVGDQRQAPAVLLPERNPVRIVREDEWNSGPVRRSAESLAPSGIHSPDRPGSSKSVYRLRFFDPQ
jgi:hypothetical protein